MAINIYIRLITSKDRIEQGTQHYEETYRFQATGDDANADIRNYRLRHFLTANTPNSTVIANTGLSVFDGTQITPVTGSYNDWTTPNRPPKFDSGNNQFNTELIMRFDVERLLSQMPINSQAWITVPWIQDNGVFSPIELESSFSFLGYSSNNVYIKNPINIALEHKVDGGTIHRIYTDSSTLPENGISNCDSSSNLYQVETVVVETSIPHSLKVGDSVTLYSRSISHAPSYTARQGRLFGKAPGERYLGDFIVTSVPSKYSFTYQTYHNPMKINLGTNNHPEYTHDTWNDLVWEKWELYEYNESVSATNNGSSVIFTFTDTDPSGITCRHNFAEKDTVTFMYNGSSKVHMVVESASNNSITAKPVDGETYPSGVTSGTLVYTPRIPSSDVAFNVKHSDIAPPNVKSHVNESAIFYACQDTYYDKSGAAEVSHGSDNEMWLVRDNMIPIIKFPIPVYDGEATADQNLVSRLFVYAKDNGGIGNNKIELLGFDTDEWTESDTNSDIERMHSGPWSGEVIGEISAFSYNHPSRVFNNRYIKFDIDNAYAVDILTGHASNTILLNSHVSGTTNQKITFASRDDVDGYWPYIAFSSLTFIGKSPKIELDNTYMYLVCDKIEMDGTGPAFVATISDKMFDKTNLMYVRSWNKDMPFFAKDDIIEIMNTEYFDTVNAQVIDVNYDEHKVYFKYLNGAPLIDSSVSECGIIRNRSRMISTYTAIDANNNNARNISIQGPTIHGGPYGYPGNPVEFDIIHEESKEKSTSLSAVYSSGDVVSNIETPIILTDLDVVEGIYDKPVDRYMHVGPDNSVILKGFNLNKLSNSATAVLGHCAFENGIDAGTEARLLPVAGNSAERKFYYDDTFNLQREIPVYGLRNVMVNDIMVTEFKVKYSDCPFIRGDVLAPIITGRYVDDTNQVNPNGLKYGVNYYIADEPVKDVDESYVWIRLSSSYIFRSEEHSTDVPTYILLDSSDVEDIDTICQTGTLMPLVLYSTVTSVTIKDSDVDTKYYYNRLYLHIDESAPICYVPEQEHVAAREFDVYISDMNDIIRINEYSLDNFPFGTISYIFGNNDSRFIKISLTLMRSTNLDIYDAAGNCTSLKLDVIRKFSLSITGIVSNDATHTLSFLVENRDDYRLLSNEIASMPGDTGIYSTFGSIQNISSVSEKSDGGGRFTFDIVVTEDELSQTDGILEVWAGDTNEGKLHDTDMWSEPIIFKKDVKCIETGDVLRYRGVNLYGDLALRGKNKSSFSIDSIESTTSASIKVVARHNGTYSFGIEWVNSVGVSLSIADYQNTVTLVPVPIIKITTEGKKVKLKKGEVWKEPEPWDVSALDGTGKDITNLIEISIDNTNWDEPGIHTITYTATDECGRYAFDTRTVIVTECDIPIILTKDSYEMFEDIEIMIAPESKVLFNQYVMNNIVQYQLNGSDEWITAVILSGTSDRKMLTIKNPGIITSNIKLKVYVGDDNIGANHCFWTDNVTFDIISHEEQDKQLDVYGKASIVKQASNSRFSDLNFEPIYNKDLSYSSFTITADENSLMQNVYSILLTNLGERLYDDEFGSTLEESVFEIIGDLNGESKLINQCVNLIHKYEPRAVVAEDKSYVSINDDNTIVIVLYIKVPRGVARKIELTFRKNA